MGRQFAVGIDAHDVIACLTRAAALEDLAKKDSFLARDEWIRLGRPSWHAELILYDYRGDAPIPVLSRAMQHLFLGMTIAHPGSCNLLFSPYIGAEDDVWPTPCLSGGRAESALFHAKKAGWPRLSTITFGEVWDWLGRTRVAEAAVGTNAVHKALFALLSICEEGTSMPATILFVMQALESLLVVGHHGVRSLARSRLEAILGEPPNDRRWFSRLYELRCRIAHGGITVARPGIVFDIGENEAVEAHLTEFFRPTDEAIAVLIAVMQDLVRSFAAGYEFAQAVARTPFRAPVV